MSKTITVKVTGTPMDVISELIHLHQLSFGESPKYIIIGREKYHSLLAEFKSIPSFGDSQLDEYRSCRIIVVQTDMLEVVSSAEKEAMRP